jgi:hypothetical protein
MAFNIADYARGRGFEVVEVVMSDHTYSNNGPLGVVVRLPDGTTEYCTQRHHLDALMPLPCVSQ